jgi:NTE family protein
MDNINELHKNKILNKTINNIYDINDVIDRDINFLLNKKVRLVRDTLVLSGGAVKGISHIGALYCLQQNNLLNDIKTIASTSAGAMVGLLYTIGYQPLELFKFMKLININQVKKLDAHNMLTKFGFDDGSRIMMILKKLMIAKGFEENITFIDLHKRTNITFIVTGTCINDKKVYYFSHIDFPNMVVLEAVRISISVPILFTPCVYEGKIFVDGGLIDNFPIHLFENNINKVIGIYVTEHIKYAHTIKTIEDYLINTFQSLFEGASQRDTMIHNQNIIIIKCTNNGETNSDIVGLFDEGYKATQDKINNKNFI